MAEQGSYEEIPLVIPPALQSKLENDCIQIVHRKKLLALPVQPSVETILRNFWSHSVATATEESNLPLLMEVLDGVKVYFDFMLKDHLLYTEEREQYDHMIKQENSMTSNCVNCEDKEKMSNESGNFVSPSSIYGAIHLLRLFVKMPFFFSHAKFPSSHVHILHQYFQDLFGYMISQAGTVFSNENYIVPENTSELPNNSS